MDKKIQRYINFTQQQSQQFLWSPRGGNVARARVITWITQRSSPHHQSGSALMWSARESWNIWYNTLTWLGEAETCARLPNFCFDQSQPQMKTALDHLASPAVLPSKRKREQNQLQRPCIRLPASPCLVCLFPSASALPVFVTAAAKHTVASWLVRTTSDAFSEEIGRLGTRWILEDLWTHKYLENSSCKQGLRWGALSYSLANILKEA